MDTEDLSQISMTTGVLSKPGAIVRLEIMKSRYEKIPGLVPSVERKIDELFDTIEYNIGSKRDHSNQIEADLDYVGEVISEWEEFYDNLQKMEIRIDKT